MNLRQRLFANFSKNLAKNGQNVFKVDNRPVLYSIGLFFIKLLSLVSTILCWKITKRPIPILLDYFGGPQLVAISDLHECLIKLIIYKNIAVISLG